MSNKIKLDSFATIEGKLYRHKQKILVFEYDHTKHNFDNIQNCFNKEGQYINSMIEEIDRSGNSILKKINKGDKLFVIEGEQRKTTARCGDLKDWEEVETVLEIEKTVSNPNNSVDVFFKNKYVQPINVDLNQIDEFLK